MPFLYESYQENPGAYFYEKALQELPQMGWLRTVLLAAGGSLGVLGSAALIHAAKGGRGEEGIRGWPRTMMLAGGAFAGTVLTASAIHIFRQAVEAGELSYVEEV